jgi:hypothetical protein
MTVTAFTILIFGIFYRFFMLNQIHEAIGIYGLKVAAANGTSIDGISGSWWLGYDILETTIKSDFGTIFGFGLGITSACFPLAIMYHYVQTAIHRIEALEKLIENNENQNAKEEP